MKIATLAVHAAGPDPGTGAIAPPIHLSTTFARDENYALPGGYQYIRESNPTQTLLETALARLDGGAAALAFGSGMAAGVALLQSLEPGSHVVFPEDVYYGYRTAAIEFFAKAGIASDFAPMDDLDALRHAIRPATKLVWVETPSNPMLRVVDIRGAVAIARQAGADVLVDNTFATPALQRPLELGADVALQASTKYIGGHSDVQGGVLVFAEKGALHERCERARHVLGAVASPFTSWLVLRGLRTLALRVERHAANALAVARALDRHPRVSAVHYPGLASHPGHAVAAGQMSAFGGMLSFQLHGGRETALQVATSTRLFTPATSLGGVESLIEHRRTSEGAGSKTPEDLLRLSVGIEHPDDLIADLEQALARIPA